MAKKRIVAYFMHESEAAAASNVMTDTEMTEAYVYGDVDENDIPGLKQCGLIVQVLDEPAPSLLDRVPHAAAMAPRRGRRRRGAAARPVQTGKPSYYVVELQGPLLEAWRRKLAEQNVRLHEAIGSNRYTVRLKPEQIPGIDSLPFVSRIREFDQDDAVPPIPRRPSAPRPSVGVRQIVTYEIRLHDGQDRDKVRQWLEDHGVAVAGARGRKIRAHLYDDDDSTVEDIRALPEVYAADEFVPPKLHNDNARVLLGVSSPPGGNPQRTLSQTGDGQIVGVADTGLDETHPDFAGRVHGVVALGRPGDSTDPHGHGTHVAGSILGDGTVSQGELQGVAPGARLFFQSVMDASGGLGGLPWDLNDLFEEAYQAGARIHNNSWGAATGSRYVINSVEVDEFVAAHRDMLIVISAGNEGSARGNLNSQPGFVDWLSIGSPASCKNALTVGASRSDRLAGGYAPFTYGQLFSEFPDPPIADQNVSGDPEALAAFSSRGPCDDYRIKPDVVAPGTDIASAKSSRAPLRNFWGPYAGHGGRYAYLGGTSMAAPLVAGCAALVRQYYVDAGHSPSAALLKATLINGTRWLTGQDAVADFSNLPNYHQGFGCIHMLSTIPNQSMPGLGLEFLDTWQIPAEQFTGTGQRFRYRVQVDGGPRLRVCLAWTDSPARALQNNLNLFVEDPARNKRMGNQGLPMSLNIPDPVNNVEVVRIDNPAPGSYMIQITASSLLGQSQDFALVATGHLGSQLVPT